LIERGFYIQKKMITTEERRIIEIIVRRLLEQVKKTRKEKGEMFILH